MLLLDALGFLFFFEVILDFDVSEAFFLVDAFCYLGTILLLSQYPIIEK
jgi:hypothetical protein